MTPSFRIAHLSDLHFAKVSYNPLQFFSKRWVGNLNLILSRKHKLSSDQVWPLIELLPSLKVDYVILSGDLTTTTKKEELQAAASFVQALREKKIEVFALPGNHDHYTKTAFRKKTFYEFFPSSYNKEYFSFDLKEAQLTVIPLREKWWLILLDTALATSLISARGLFTESLEKRLEEVLTSIPPDHAVILANHYPLFDHESPRKRLRRSSALREVIRRFPHVQLYLNGHSHRHCWADLRSNHYPLVLDSGSVAHLSRGSWHLLEISPTTYTVDKYVWNLSSKTAEGSWQRASQKIFAKERKEG